MHELWLQGLSTRDFEPSLRALLGETTPLSPSTISRVNKQFLEDYSTWSRRPIADEYVYVWADGVYFDAGAEDERRVMLAVIGVTTNGDKDLLALEDAFGESTESWTVLFEGLRDRGLRTVAMLVADGAPMSTVILCGRLNAAKKAGARELAWHFRSARRGRLRDAVFSEGSRSSFRKLTVIALSAIENCAKSSDPSHAEHCERHTVCKLSIRETLLGGSGCVLRWRQPQFLWSLSPSWRLTIWTKRLSEPRYGRPLVWC